MTLYEPREDSFLLAKYVRKYAKGSVLDMCAGSGIQAKTALTNKNVKSILAVDIDESSIIYLKKQNIPAVKSDLFKNVKGKFNTIICNPPYLPEFSKEDYSVRRAVSGGKKGNEFLAKFLKEAKNYLAKEGIIILLVSSLTLNVETLFKKYNYGTKLLEQQNFFFERIQAWMLSERLS